MNKLYCNAARNLRCRLWKEADFEAVLLKQCESLLVEKQINSGKGKISVDMQKLHGNSNILSNLAGEEWKKWRIRQQIWVLCV